MKIKKKLFIRTIPLVAVCILMSHRIVGLPIIIVDITVCLLALWAVIGLVKYWKTL